MKLAVTDCDLRLYTDDTCLLFSNENVNFIKKHLNVDFNSLCIWGKIKLNVFYLKRERKSTQH